MNLNFDTPYLSDLIEKLEENTLQAAQHSYLQKIFAARMIVNQYQSDKDSLQEFYKHTKRYYAWISQNWNKNTFTKKEKTDLFLLKNSIEKNYSEKGLPSKELEEINSAQSLSHFEILSALAEIWEQPLQKNRDSILSFLAFFMEKAYGIPNNLIEKIFMLLNSRWILALPPMGNLSEQKFSLTEIENYFFGSKSKPEFSLHVIDNIDRLFSIAGKNHSNHIFLPKTDDFDVFDAALVIHEFQHVIDAVQETKESAVPANEYVKSICDDLFLFEKKALHAEKVFLLSQKIDKRKRFAWLESNLFYPAILLQCELENLVAQGTNSVDFDEICLSHQMEPVPLSALFEWGAPFQMSVYCAAAMDLERSWGTYLQ